MVRPIPALVLTIIITECLKVNQIQLSKFLNLPTFSFPQCVISLSPTRWPGHWGYSSTSAGFVLEGAASFTALRAGRVPARAWGARGMCMVLTHWGSSWYHFRALIGTQQNHKPCDSQRRKYHCEAEDSCFHNRANCMLHHRPKLVVKTVIKTDRQWNMTHLEAAASQAHCPWPLFKSPHLHFLNSKHRRCNY